MSECAKFRCSQLISGCHIGRCECSTNSESNCGCSPMIRLPSISDLISKNQCDDRKITIQKLKEIVRGREKIALGLGAGVSIPVKLPNWYGLVSKMLGYSIQYDIMNNRKEELTEEDIARAYELTNAMINGNLESLRSTDTLESGEYIAQHFSDPDASEKVQRQIPGMSMQIMLERMLRKAKMPLQFLEEMQVESKGIFGPNMSISDLEIVTNWWKNLQKEKSLFGQLESLATTLPRQKDDILKIIAKENTMAAISYLLSSSNGIRKVMTYNYDPMVEVYTHELYGNSILCRDGEDGCLAYPSGEDLEIFHVHGFVPGWIREKYSYLNLPNTSESLILSEDSYYDIERSGIYDWSSRTQACFLNDWSCIFVGFSASDYNFKRILRQMEMRRKPGCNEECKHYIIFTVDDIAKTTYQDICKYYISKNISTNAEQIQKDTLFLLRNILECKRRYWQRFNIKPIWITVPEISELLVSLVNP